MAKVILGINYQVDFTSIPTNALPVSDNTKDLGSSSYRWKTFYIANVGTSLIPNADGTLDLGSSSYRWKDLWLSGNTIYLGTNGQLKYNTTSSKLQFSNNAGTNYDFLERHTMSDIYDNLASGAINFNNGITQKTSVNGAISFSNAIAGRVYTLILTSGSKGSLSIPCTWSYGVVPVWSTGTDIVTILYNGTSYYANASIGF